MKWVVLYFSKLSIYVFLLSQFLYLIICEWNFGYYLTSGRNCSATGKDSLFLLFSTRTIKMLLSVRLLELLKIKTKLRIWNGKKVEECTNSLLKSFLIHYNSLFLLCLKKINKSVRKTNKIKGITGRILLSKVKM